MMPSIRQATLLTNLLIPLLFLLGHPSSGYSQFVPGKVIVKFVEQTEGDRAVIQAGQTTPINLHGLSSIIDRLQSHTNLPLKGTQVTSGQRVILSVETNILTNRVIKQLNLQDNIATASLVPLDPHQQTRFSPSNAIAITFVPESIESAIVHRKPQIESNSEFMKIISDLGKIVHLPLKGQLSTGNTVTVQVDLSKLTLSLIEQLQSLPDIASAQPNYISTIQ
ncbi:MAG: hypothetical protein ACPGYT_09080 [Nitrospirales bacterium]